MQKIAGDPLNVLVVEDDLPIALMIASILSDEGYEVDTAANGRLALEKIAAKEYDLILSDLRMVSLFFTYRDLSDADLGRYVSFLESPTGRWFTRIVQSAFLTSLDPFDQPKPARATAPGVKRPRVSEAAVAADSSD